LFQLTVDLMVVGDLMLTRGVPDPRVKRSRWNQP
jgi:hypothetical protein